MGAKTALKRGKAQNAQEFFIYNQKEAQGVSPLEQPQSQQTNILKFDQFPEDQGPQKQDIFSQQPRTELKRDIFQENSNQI